MPVPWQCCGSSAVASAAEFLVTGDRKHLLSLGNYKRIRICTPREFLDFLGKQA
jgi:predicted nucleic acid-binding protein